MVYIFNDDLSFVNWHVFRGATQSILSVGFIRCYSLSSRQIFTALSLGRIPDCPCSNYKNMGETLVLPKMPCSFKKTATVSAY